MTAANLIRADLLKMKRDKALKIIIIVMTALNLAWIVISRLTIFLLESLPDGAQVILPFNTAGAAYTSLFAIGDLGLFVVLACVLFTNKEFSYHTVRARVCANSRLKVFNSTLISNLLIGTGLLAITAVEGGIFTALFFTGYSINLTDMLLITVSMLPLYWGFICIATFVTLALKGQTSNLIVNLLIVIVLPTLLEVVSVVAMADDGVQTFLSIIPYSLVGILSAGTVSGDLIAKAFISSIVLAGIAYGLGYLTFRKADLK